MILLSRWLESWLPVWPPFSATLGPAQGIPILPDLTQVSSASTLDVDDVVRTSRKSFGTTWCSP